MSVISAGESAELHERTKRRRSVPAGRSSCSRARTSWWGVGEAVNHVGFAVCISGQKPRGLKWSGAITVPPDPKVARADATSP